MTPQDEWDRPVITCLVGWYVYPIGLVWSKVVALEDAVHYRTLGFSVLVDPVKQIELASWERTQRWARYWATKQGEGEDDGA